MSDCVLFDKKKHIGVITLNRPDALNALNPEMIDKIYHQLLAWQEDDSIHAVIIKAAPGRAFCAGGDIRWLYNQAKESMDGAINFFDREYDLNTLIFEYTKPYIALMDGITMGGGVGISLHGSHRVATSQYKFAMPETGIGFYPDVGVGYWLSRCKANAGVYLGLTGNSITALEAKYLGFVDYIVPEQAFESIEAQLYAEDLSLNANKKVNACIAEHAETSAELTNPEIWQWINESFCAPSIEEICGQLKLKNSTWHQNILNTLEKKSPLSLKVTLKHLQTTKTKSFRECIEQDKHLVRKFLKDNDFLEGVRALLIDKDKNPSWDPKTLSEIKQNKLDSYFSFA